MAAITAKTRETSESEGIGTQLPFEAIQEPGCYICNWSGHLLRVPDDAVAQGRSPLMMIRGKEPLFVTKISDDPFVQVSKARIRAADKDVCVNF
jgi:hypothetical protein